MGVKGLWELLAPVGRRVSVETLAGKKLAIDASIWMVQFMKAMRDEKGEMVRNAHLLGFFRRICKLLFLRTKPVFVFDGGTPVLKRRTVIARRRQRENAQAKVRKTAEKLLLNHLKSLKLKKLSDDVKNQRLKQNGDAKGQKKSDQVDLIGCDLGRNNEKEQDKTCGAEVDKNISKATVSTSFNQEDLDAMLAASIVAEEDELLTGKAPCGVVSLSEEEEDTDPEIILPALGAEVDLSVLAALPQSMQFDILSQLKGKKVEGSLKDSNNQKQFEVSEKDRGKGKGILLHEVDTVGCRSSSDDIVAKKYNQDKVDEMLAASILAEENEKLVNNASTSGGPFMSEEDDFINDEDEEMILPAMHGKVDPAVLASLPPSMQLDLLGQMRERLIAENRQKYQKVKKDPAKFSELQIQAYLKTVAFRREINEVQKVAAGGEVGGVQTSRIASEANREYIFSRSFTGDKQELTCTSLEKNKNTHQKTLGNHFSQGFVNNSDPANDSSASSGLACSEAGSPSDENIQTYLDERGQFHVSRLRAMGMRMTRDIQRNLDLMKEIEQERTVVNKAANNNAILSGEKNVASKASSNLLVDTSDGSNVDLVGDNSRNEHAALAGDASLEISFMDDGDNKCINDDGDDLFASLVAGNSVAFSSADKNSLKEQVSDSSSDCDWEEGIVEGKSGVHVEIKSPVSKDNYNDESDVEWEDGVCDDANTTVCAAEAQKKTSRGCLEEEADLQEAIRRSLEVMGDCKLNGASSRHEYSNADGDRSDYALNQDDNLVDSGVKSICGNFGAPKTDAGMGESTLHREGNTEHRESNYKIIDDKMDGTVRSNKQVSQSPEGQSESSVAFDSEKTVSFIKKPHSMEIGSHSEDLLPTADESRRNEIHMAAEQLLDTLNEDGKVFANGNKSPVADALGASKEEKKNCSYEAEPFGNYSEKLEPVAPFVDSSSEGLTEDLDTQPEFPRENCGRFEKRKSDLGKDAMEPPGLLSAQDLETQSELPGEDNHGSFEESKNNLVEDAMDAPGHLFADAIQHGLEEEIRILGQEYTNLAYEQRKLERNAESVNSELFTECQELLQMFGLPYIIAPMEAEAQCAYLELAKLVDGVVTDDSDVFLFGACSVYKNIFDDRKYVETYFMEDIEKELGLTREKLIHMALLLGSDYTEGVSGIGIVNAIEVVNAFPEEDGLLKFRQWVESPDPTIFGRFETKSGSSTRKKGSKVEENLPGKNCNIEETMTDQNISHAQEHDSSDDIQETKQIFMNKHRNVSKNWHIPSSFPSETVISAYSCPQVDKSTDPFAWGKPDHLVLRKLCWEKFGWTSQKADELLLPVLKEYNKNETQLRLEAFYTFNERFAKIRSKRIKKAVKGITGDHPSEFTDEPAEDLSNRRKNETGIPAELGISKSETFKGTGESPADMKPLNLKQSRKRKNFGDTVAKTQSRKKGKLNAPVSASGLPEVDVQTGAEQAQPSDDNGLSRNRSNKVRGKGVRVPRGRRKRSLGTDSRKTTSSDSESDDHEPEVHGINSRGTEGVRRSLRSRKSVNYAMDNIETEDNVASSHQSNKTDLNREQTDEIFSGLHGVCGNDDSGVSRHKESTINLSPKKDLPRSYLESGGGFCTDEEKTSHAGASNCDSSHDADYLKVGGGFCLDDNETGSKHNEIHEGDDDYLRVGGGFCLDEDETGSKNNEIHDDSATIVDDSAELTRVCSGFVDEAECGKNITYQSSSVNKTSGIELQDRGNTKLKSVMNHDSVNTRSNYDQLESDTGVWISENAQGDTENAAAAFSAMPFLRKKRRKS